MAFSSEYTERVLERCCTCGSVHVFVYSLAWGLHRPLGFCQADFEQKKEAQAIAYAARCHLDRIISSVSRNLV